MALKLQDYLTWCAQKYTTLKPRSIHQVQTYLRRKVYSWVQKYEPDTSPESLYASIDPIIATLVEQRVLDDHQFVKWYIAEKQYFKSRGMARMRYELISKGVSSDILDEALQKAEFTDNDIISHTIQSRFSHLNLSDPQIQKKVTSRLMQKGFRYTDIRSALQRAIEE